MSDRREQIVDIAARRFARHGYAATSMRDIASDCGIKASSLYSHFASKAEILQLLLDPVTASVREAQDRALDGGGDGITHLRRLIRGVLEVCVKYPAEMTILHYSWPQIREEAELSPVVEATAQTFATWRDAVQAGLDDDSIRPDVDPSTMARVITSAIQSLSDSRRYQDESSLLTTRGFEQLLHDLDAVVVGGLATTSGSTKT